MKHRLKVCSTSLSDRQNAGHNAPPGTRLSRKLIKLLLCLLVVVFATSGDAFSQRGSAENVGAKPAGLSSEELTAVLQKCIELPGIQKYYPVQKESNLKQVTVVQYPVVFPQNLDLTKSGKSVNFLAHPDPKSPGYFMFRTVENSDGKVTVSYNYFYKGSDTGTKILTGSAELAKTGTSWKVITSNLKGDI